MRTSSSTTLSQHAPQRGDWYINPVVTLTASDGWGAGVAGTQYRLDEGKWTPYSTPFRVLGPGTHTIAYRSTDANGNQEETRSLSFQNYR